MLDVSLIPKELSRINDPGEVRNVNYGPWLEYCVDREIDKAIKSGIINEETLPQEALEIKGAIRKTTLDSLLPGLDQLTVVRDGDEVPLTPDYFYDSEMWVSNAFNLALFDAVAGFLGNPNPWDDIAKYFLKRRSELTPEGEKRIKLRLGPRGIFEYADEENQRWNRTKSITPEVFGNRFRLLLQYRDDITRDAKGRRVTRHVCEWNMSLYRRGVELFNRGPISGRQHPFFNRWKIPPAEISERACTARGDPFCEFTGSFVDIRDPIVKGARVYYRLSDTAAALKDYERLQRRNEELTRRAKTQEELATQRGRELAASYRKIVDQERKAEQELAQLQAQLDEAVLYQITAHDLNNRLPSLKTMVELVMRRGPSLAQASEKLRGTDSDLAERVHKLAQRLITLAADAEPDVVRIGQTFDIMRRYQSGVNISLQQSLEDQLGFMQRELATIEVHKNIADIGTPSGYNAAAFFKPYRAILINAKDAIVQRKGTEPNLTGKILVKTAQIEGRRFVHFYDNGIEMPELDMARYGKEKFSTKGGLGIAVLSAGKIAQKYNGLLYAGPSDVQEYTKKITIEFREAVA